MPDFEVDIKFIQNQFKLDAKFELSKSRVTVALGASGCGKSTLLRLLAGLENPTEGLVHCNDETWFNSGKGINYTPQKRSVGFVFQDYALFENMIVADNIGFGVEKSSRTKIVEDLLVTLDLVSHKDKHPSELSGGQKQRVALGRALAIRPKILLLDEPLSAIDHGLRKELQRELKAYIKKIECPVLFVTHDLSEARMMADDIIVLSDGNLIRKGPANLVLNHPVNKTAAKILGWSNFIPITDFINDYAITNWGKFKLNSEFIPGADCIAIRPENIRFGKIKPNSLSAKVTEVYDFGLYKEFHCYVDCNLTIIVHRPANEPLPHINSTVNLHLSSQHLSLLGKNSRVPNCFDAKLIKKYAN